MESSMKPCPWCNVGQDGTLRQFYATDPENKDRLILIKFSGGSLTVDMRLGADAELEQITFPINYCPVCGALQRSKPLTIL